MANMYNIDELSYQPSTNMEWYTKALFGGKAIEAGKITPITGVKKSTLLNMLNLAGSLLQADNSDCAWTPKQIAKLSEKLLEVKNYKINLEQCIDDLERKRTIYMLKPGAKNTELPDALEDATMAMLAEELSKEIETLIFTGDSSVNSNDFDGAVTVLKNSSEAIKIAGVGLTKDNVLDEVEKMFVALSENNEDALQAGIEANDLTFYVSASTILKIKLALAGVFGNNVVIRPNWAATDNAVSYMGVDFFAIKGMPSDDMILTRSSNLIFGTDLESDLEEMRLGQFPAPNDSKIFIDGRLRLGFIIPFEDEVVYYSPDNEDASGQGASGRIAPLSTEPTRLEIIADINNSEDVDYINDIIERETEGENRTTVIKAAEKRINELQKD